MNRSFPGKIILFGEYSVLIGSSALATPALGFKANWIQETKEVEINPSLIEYLNDFSRAGLDINSLKQAFKDGWRVQSNIPQGYGMGSSGAFIAAIYDKFVSKNPSLSISDLKTLLGRMESFFHGNSSGIDPLVSYLNKTILISNNNLEVLNGPIPSFEEFKIRLVDSGSARQSDVLVHSFKEKMKSAAFSELMTKNLLPAVDGAIHAYLDNNVYEVKNYFQQISNFQWEHMQEMIPDPIKKIWLQGMEDQTHLMKLCGAGGGGFFLRMDY
jgi:mevalonate kinase